MATGSDNDFAEVTEEMALEKFKMWTLESLRTYPSEIRAQRGTLRPQFTGLFYSMTANFVLVYFSQIKEDMIYAKKNDH